MADTQELMRVLKKAVLAIFPELSGYHYPIRGKVVKVNESGGRIDEFNRRYSVDVQPLKPDGSVDEMAPVIPDVEVPVIWAGPGRGIYASPEVGAIVRIGFYYNDPAQPFVDAILGDGYECPDHPPGALIIQHSDGTRIEIGQDRVIRIITEESREEKAKKAWRLEAKNVEVIAEVVSVKGNLAVEGNISATGTILDEGGNTAHHSH